MTHQEYAAGLHHLADWFAAHPDVPLPDDPIRVFAGCNNKSVMGRIARALGKAEKVQEPDSNLFRVCGDFGGIRVEWISLLSDVCERKVIGTEEVPAEIVPAHTREIVEWECSALLEPEEEVAVPYNP
mgnify:CR=1 FL=1